MTTKIEITTVPNAAVPFKSADQDLKDIAAAQKQIVDGFHTLLSIGCDGMTPAWAQRTMEWPFKGMHNTAHQAAYGNVADPAQSPPKSSKGFMQAAMAEVESIDAQLVEQFNGDKDAIANHQATDTNYLLLSSRCEQAKRNYTAKVALAEAIREGYTSIGFAPFEYVPYVVKTQAQSPAATGNIVRRKTA